MNVYHAEFKRDQGVQYIKTCDKCNTRVTNYLMVDICQGCGSTTSIIGITWEIGEEEADACN